MFSAIAKFLTKQFLIGKLWFWIKPKIHGLLLLALIIFLIIYIHGEYLAFIEISQNVNSQEYLLGTSFLLKNGLILLAIIVYLSFVLLVKRTQSVEKKPIITQKIENEKLEKAESLDFLLEEDEFK
tara:strand:- start:82 stop:459 length:378 start_codon:yes stop_codon:yes gene_type:complete